MRAPSVVWLLAVAFVPLAASAEEDPPQPYQDVVELSGTLRCRVAAPGVASHSCPASSDSNATENVVKWVFALGLSGMIVELHWDAEASGPQSLRLEYGDPFHGPNATSAVEGGSPLIANPAGATWLEAETPWSATVLPRQGADAGVALEQSFTITVRSFHYGTAASHHDDHHHDHQHVDVDDSDAPAPEANPSAEGMPHADPGLAGQDAEPASLEALSPSHGIPVPSELLAYGFGGAFALSLPFLLAPRGRRWLAPFLPLFTRLRRDKVLDHPRRDRLMELVEGEPGIALDDARRRLALANGAFEHHLRVLVEHGLVRRHVMGARVFLYPGSAPAMPVAPPAQRPLAVRVLETVQEHPGLRAIDLSRLLDVPETTLRHHTVWLARQGQLRLVEDGRAVRCYPGP